jgi:aromatic ring-cleaving dioxygenase
MSTTQSVGKKSGSNAESLYRVTFRDPRDGNIVTLKHNRSNLVALASNTPN